MDAFQLLNTDCWRIIFRKISAQDYLNCRLCCKLFHTVLNDVEFQRKWKFHLAIPHLLPYLKKDRPLNRLIRIGNESTQKWEDVFILRQTCDSWSKSIDDYLEKAAANFVDCSQISRIPIHTKISSVKQLNDFERDFVKNTSNPFPSKSVHICEDYLDNHLKIKYFRKIRLFFINFGAHISTLKLTLYYSTWRIDRHNPVGFYALLHTMTVNLNSLKDLYLRAHVMFKDDATFINVANLSRTRKLGALKNLKNLYLDLQNQAFFNLMLDNYASGVNSFETNGLSLDAGQIEKFQNLQVLFVTITDWVDTLPVLRFLQSPLKSLHVTFSPYNVEPNEKWFMDKFLFNISHLATLQYLDMNILDSRIIVIEKGLKRSIYQNNWVERLRLRFVSQNQRQISFNFLMALKNLQVLKVHRVGSEESIHPKLSKEAVTLNRYLKLRGRVKPNAIYRSNIWKKVPSLKKVEIANSLGPVNFNNITKAYTRELYIRKSNTKYLK